MATDRTFGQFLFVFSLIGGGRMALVHDPIKSGVAAGRTRILQAASVLFAERGFRGVSISDVAVAAGLVKSAIYHHFENKEALYLAVLKEVALQSRDQMKEGAQGGSWQERLRGAVQVLGRLARPRSHVLSLVVGGMTQMHAGIATHLQDSVIPLRHEFASVVRGEIQAGIAAGELRDVDPDLSAMCLVGLVLAALQSFSSLDEQARVDFAFELFLRGAQRLDVA